MGPYKNPGHGDVVDIGGSQMADGIVDRLFKALGENVPTLPDELLYTDKGLPIWNQIIFQPEFYQTHDEIALFNAHGGSIAERFDRAVTMIDLGAGDTRKVEHLLAAFEKAKAPATYLALDISKSSLEHNVDYLAAKHSQDDSVVTCAGIWGTFDNGLEHVKNIDAPRLFLSLGSVLCNDPWGLAIDHLKHWADVLRPDDLLLVGMDGHLEKDHRQKIWDAYHTSNDLYREFFVQGFNHANKLVGKEWFHEADWDFEATLESDPTVHLELEQPGRHRFFFRAKRDMVLNQKGRTIANIAKGQELDWFDSHKYGEESVRMMCSKAHLTVLEVWKLPNSEFRQYLLKKKGPKDEKGDADSAVSGLN